MTKVADGTEHALPKTAAIHDPRLRIEQRPFPGFLGDRLLSALRWLFPPLATIGYLIRACLPARFTGLETPPRSPWPPLHAALFAGGLGYASLALIEPGSVARWLDSLATRLGMWCVEGWPAGDGTGQAIVAKCLGWCARGLEWMSGHTAIVLFVVGVYLLTWCATRQSIAIDRAVSCVAWSKVQKLILHLRGHDTKPVRSNWIRHAVVQTVILALVPALLAFAYSFVVPPFAIDDPKRSWPPAAAMGALVVVGLLAAWIARRFARSVLVAPPAPLEEKAEKETAGLPDLRIGGEQALPQMPPGAPLRTHARGLAALHPGHRMPGRFSELYVRGLCGDFAYLPGGDQAGRIRFGASSLQVVDVPVRERASPEVPKGADLVSPAEITRNLLAIMYISASVSGRIRKRHNAIIRDFCRYYEVCLLLTEEELSRIVLELGERKWRVPEPEQAAEEIRERLGTLAELPAIAEYLDRYRMAHPEAPYRAQVATFRSTLEAGFRNLRISFANLGNLLVQAVVFADRKIGAEEQQLLALLKLQGDYGAGLVVETAEDVTKGKVSPTGGAGETTGRGFAAKGQGSATGKDDGSTGEDGSPTGGGEGAPPSSPGRETEASAG